MGRLHKIKGYDNLIKSFALLLKEKPNSKLMIAGSGDTYKHELISLIKKLRLENSVFLVGQLNDEEKKKFYQVVAYLHLLRMLKVLVW